MIKNYIKQCFGEKAIWLLVVEIAVLLGLLLLGGCTSVFYSATKQPTIEKQCQQSQVLYTNLKLPNKERNYFLVDGEMCQLGKQI